MIRRPLKRVRSVQPLLKELTALCTPLLRPVCPVIVPLVPSYHRGEFRISPQHFFERLLEEVVGSLRREYSGYGKTQDPETKHDDQSSACRRALKQAAGRNRFRELQGCAGKGL